MNKTVEITGHPSVLEVAMANDIPLSHSCGGMASCTTCLIVIKKGLEKIPPRNELEQEHATSRGFKTEERLGCQTPADDGLVVFIPPES
jgi:ferredoxin